MNERFNFRVWNNRHGMYWDFEDIVLTPQGRLLDRDRMVIDPKEYTIEQCTGVRDCNGKLIFEGDQVAIPNQYPFYDYADGVEHKSLNDTCGEIEHDAIPNYIGVVEWGWDRFYVVIKCVNPKKSGISDGFTEDLTSEYEIIGNIHDGEA